MEIFRYFVATLLLVVGKVISFIVKSDMFVTVGLVWWEMCTQLPNYFCPQAWTSNNVTEYMHKILSYLVAYS